MERLWHPKPELVKRPSVGFKGRKSTARRDKSHKPQSINDKTKGKPVSMESLNKEMKCEPIPKIDIPTPKTLLVGDVKQGTEGIFIAGKIENVKTSILIDTGSSATIISPELFDRLMLSVNIKSSNIRLRSANGENIEVMGECSVNFVLGDVQVSHTVIVANIQNSCILGVDFMSKYACNIYMKERILRIQGIDIPYVCDRADIIDRNRVMLTEDEIVPPNSKVSYGMVGSPLLTGEIAIVEPTTKSIEKPEELICKTLVKVNNAGESIIPIRYTNINDQNVKVHEGTTVVVNNEKVDDMYESCTDSINSPNHIQCKTHLLKFGEGTSNSSRSSPKILYVEKKEGTILTCVDYPYQNSDNISVKDNYPIPQNVRDARSFLGLCYHHKKFVHEFVDIVKLWLKLAESQLKF